MIKAAALEDHYVDHSVSLFYGSGAAVKVYD